MVSRPLVAMIVVQLDEHHRDDFIQDALVASLPKQPRVLLVGQTGRAQKKKGGQVLTDARFAASM